MKHINETLFSLNNVLNQSQGLEFATLLNLLIPDAVIFTVDQNRHIRYWNHGAEKHLGFLSSELIGELCLSGNRCTECMRGCSLSEKGKVEGYLLRLHTASGVERSFKKYAMAFANSDGEFDGGIEVLLPQATNPIYSYREDNLNSVFQGLLSNDPAMQKVFEIVRRVAATNMPVLVRGESGTGKELIAKAIHQESPRQSSPFVVVNCASLNASLLESELFGHVKGAFTGAIKVHAGVFERARGGTLFLDEIAEIPIELQAKLLRVLETGEFTPVGGEKPLTANVRIVSATHRALREEVKHGRFREDLLYRLRVVPIFLPPLRERRNDIPYLASHLLKQYLGTNAIPTFSAEAMRLLISADWFGNIRELKNAIQYALIMYDGNEIDTRHLPPEISSNVLTKHFNSKPVNKSLKRDKKSIQEVLNKCGGNLTDASIELGVSRTTLWRYRKQYDK